jgi:Transglycosylase SLT domain
MPGTARWRGLNNPFDVIAALKASASYLGDLRNRFGNLGLAAAAYNAGPQRVPGLAFGAQRSAEGNAPLCPNYHRPFGRGVVGRDSSRKFRTSPTSALQGCGADQQQYENNDQYRSKYFHFLGRPNPRMRIRRPRFRVLPVCITGRWLRV